MTFEPASEPLPTTGQPVGLKVDAHGALRPGPATLQGRYGRVERLDPARHGGGAVAERARRRGDVDLYVGLWSVRRQNHPFMMWLDSRVPLDDPYSYDRRPAAPRGRHRDPDGNQAGDAQHRGRPHRVFASAAAHAARHRGAISLARYAFETLGYRRYEWKCNALNAPSRRAALRYGFTYEGTARQAMVAKGRNRDTAWFSMLDSEWPARKAAFEAWLAAENFDAGGRRARARGELNKSRLDRSPTSPLRRARSARLEGRGRSSSCI